MVPESERERERDIGSHNGVDRFPKRETRAFLPERERERERNAGSHKTGQPFSDRGNLSICPPERDDVSHNRFSNREPLALVPDTHTHTHSLFVHFIWSFLESKSNPFGSFSLIVGNTTVLDYPFFIWAYHNSLTFLNMGSTFLSRTSSFSTWLAIPRAGAQAFPTE